MSFTSKDILKAFVSDASFLTDETQPDGFAEALLQVDDLIYQKTGIAAPTDPTTARAKLRFIANSILQWMTLGYRKNIAEFEYKRCKEMYDDAISVLDKIENGDETLMDDAGLSLTDSVRPESFITSTQRLINPL